MNHFSLVKHYLVFKVWPPTTHIIPDTRYRLHSQIDETGVLKVNILKKTWFCKQLLLQNANRDPVFRKYHILNANLFIAYLRPDVNIYEANK